MLDSWTATNYLTQSVDLSTSLNITYKSIPIATLKLAVTDVTDLVFHFFSLAKKYSLIPFRALETII